MTTLKIKSTNPEQQGEYVEIDAVNFDPATMTLLEGEASPVALSVGISNVPVPMIDGESLVDFAERVTRVYAPMFASLTDDERGELAKRLSDMTTEQEPPTAKETAAQKRAKLKAEAEAAALA